MCLLKTLFWGYTIKKECELQICFGIFKIIPKVIYFVRGGGHSADDSGPGFISRHAKRIFFPPRFTQDVSFKNRHRGFVGIDRTHLELSLVGGSA